MAPVTDTLVMGLSWFHLFLLFSKAYTSGISIGGYTI